MNRRTIPIVLFLVAVFAVSAVGAATSSAAMVLPLWSGAATEASGEGGSNSLKVAGGAAIVCTSFVIDEFIIETSRHLGPGALRFGGCKQGGEPCFSLGGAGEVILMTAIWHLVLRTVGGVDTHFLLWLVKLLHVECPMAVVRLFLITGDVSLIIARAGKSTTTFNFTGKTVNGEGKIQEYSEFENEAGTGIKTKLEVEQEGGKAKEAFAESLDNTLKFPSATSIED
jgi:hypothetical protein